MLSSNSSVKSKPSAQDLSTAGPKASWTAMEHGGVGTDMAAAGSETERWDRGGTGWEPRDGDSDISRKAMIFLAQRRISPAACSRLELLLERPLALDCRASKRGTTGKKRKGAKNCELRGRDQRYPHRNMPNDGPGLYVNNYNKGLPRSCVHVSVHIRTYIHAGPRTAHTRELWTASCCFWSSQLM